MSGRDRRGDRALATVFFTDMVGSTELAARLGDQQWRELLTTYHRVVGRAIRHDGGREVDSAGDGLFAVFDSPAAAIRCAGSLTDTLHRLGIEVRTGLHMGEVEHMGGKVGGIAVHLGARVSAVADPGEILVTSTVRDLVSGSEIRCLDRGVRTLKGIPGEWRIYAIDRPDAVALDAHAAIAGGRPAARGLRARLLLIGVPAALVVVAAVAAVLLLGHRAGTSPPATVAAEANTVARADAAGGGGFLASVHTGNQPEDLAVGGGSVWVGNYLDATVARVDATSGAVSVFAPGGKPTGIAFGNDAVWVTTEFGETSGGPGSVIRFNPVTNGIDKVIQVGDGVHSIAYSQSPEGVWVTNEVNDTVVRIDPASNAVDPTPVDLGRKPEAIAAGDGSVWVGGADRTLLRIDPATRRITTIQLRSTPSAIAVGDGAVWVASNDANSVIRVDPTTDAVVTTIAVDAGPSGIAAADGGVWVTASTAGSVDRIDPSTDAVVARLTVHGRPLAAAAMGSDAWVTVSGG
jgi:class 3 adenylate cyclase/streptogramin lyase